MVLIEIPQKKPEQPPVSTINSGSNHLFLLIAVKHLPTAHDQTQRNVITNITAYRGHEKISKAFVN